MRDIKLTNLLLASADAFQYLLTSTVRGKRKHLLVACMPKSGSTYLTSIIGNLPGITEGSLVPGYGRREQELDIAHLIWLNQKSYVAQHHVRYSETLCLQMSQFRIIPIVLVRNIYDVVVSIRDHFRNESVIGSQGYAFPNVCEWQDSKIDDFISVMFLPWYFNFYLSWLECEGNILFQYDDLISNPVNEVKRIAEHCKLHVDLVDIEKAVQSANVTYTRKNKGISGRGAGLSAGVKKQIRKMADYYKGVDFTPIGIFD